MKEQIFYGYLLGCIVVYTLYGMLSYFDNLKQHWYFIPIGLLLSLIGNALWLFYVKKQTDSSTILTHGTIWDFAITICFIASPFLIGKGSELTTSTVVGLVISIIGLFIMKFSWQLNIFSI